jgi:hypothetical protein
MKKFVYAALFGFFILKPKHLLTIELHIDAHLVIYFAPITTCVFN